LLKEYFHITRAAATQRLRRWLADLDSSQFQVRKQAQVALEQLGELAEPALRQTLAHRPTLEVRQRVEVLLERLRQPVTQPEALRSLRAVGVLEELAAGVPEARLSREAKAALQRLARRSASSP